MLLIHHAAFAIDTQADGRTSDARRSTSSPIGRLRSNWWHQSRRPFVTVLALHVAQLIVLSDRAAPCSTSRDAIHTSLE